MEELPKRCTGKIAPVPLFIFSSIFSTSILQSFISTSTKTGLSPAWTIASDVAKKERLTYDRILGIVKRNVKKEVDWDEFDKIPVLGIDEIANLKGHREYFAIISAQIDGEVKILAVLSDRKKATVKKFFSEI